MQITDMLNQYNRNLAGGAEISGGTQGIRQVAAALSEWSVGNVFEGSINHLEDGMVTLGLPDGKTIQAKLDSGVSVRVGESMFFQVRSNNGTQIAIRPFSNGTAANPALFQALSAANLKPDGRMVTMVNAMMEQSMSIDKQSLMNMARLVAANDGMDVTSVVQMVKLGIPVTEEMAAQFENYKSDQYAILDQLESVMELLPEKLGDGSLSRSELLELNRQMVQALFGEISSGEAASGQSGAQGAAEEGVFADGKVLVQSPGVPEEGSAVSVQAKEAEQTQQDKIPVRMQMQAGEALDAAEEVTGQQKKAGQVQQQTEATQAGQTGNEKAAVPERSQEEPLPLQTDAIKNILTDKELLQLSRQLGKIPELAEYPALFEKGTLSGDITAKEFLQLLGQALTGKDADGRQALSELLSSRTYRVLVRNAMEQQWLLRPEELKGERKINELYERLDRQLAQMERVLKSFGQNSQQLSNTAANVRDNIQFMNQINQTYAYVQIPLKLAGQNAHSDLFVYADKRKRHAKDGELTAFLHLDLEHLGSTDVSIKMVQKQVAANFYLSDDISYQLILEHLDELQKRLKDRGFSAQIQVINQEEKVNFMEDMLRAGSSLPGGMVHRYSFDVRA